MDFPPLGARFSAASAPVRAGLLATLAAAGFACMSTLIRLAGQELHPFEIVFFRNAFALLFMMPWLASVGFAGLYTRRLGLHLARAALSLTSMLCGFTAVILIPITEATALSFTAPLFSTLGAALILGEVVRIRRWTALLIGFAGAMVILRPGVAEPTLGAILALANAGLMAAAVLVVKSLSRTERPEAIVTYMTLFVTPLSLLPALFVWRMPGIETTFWLLALALAGTVGHVAMTRAFAAADISLVLPFDFARLPFTAALAFVAFGEVPTVWTWIGGTVIFASTFYIARREAMLARARMRTGTQGS